jgi:alkanesulfonate monooxygenase SsuD/methylene tetrahydromethanopterin reductase-like flavin-dependent oxidoreductase (luciferase family)
LPYGFASHFAPSALQPAVALYRREFRASAQLAAPYVIAGVNVIAADDEQDAQRQFRDVQRSRVKVLYGRGRNWSDAEAEAILESPAGQHLRAMATYSAVGTAAQVHEYVADFARAADADELITVHPSPTRAERLRSIELLAPLIAGA